MVVLNRLGIVRGERRAGPSQIWEKQRPDQADIEVVHAGEKPGAIKATMAETAAWIVRMRSYGTV
jgi:hypothetical protein